MADLTPEQRATADAIMVQTTEELIESVRHFIVDHMTPRRKEFQANRTVENATKFQIELAIAQAELNARIVASVEAARARLREAGVPELTEEEAARAKAIAEQLAGGAALAGKPTLVMPEATD